MKLTENEINRFWASVNRTDSCWLWDGPIDGRGYGRFNARRNGKTKVIRASRLSYAMAHGEFDPELFVCHHCDTPLCIRPDHLFLGTHHDNMQDMIRKNRAATSGRTRIGEKNPRAKLTWSIVREIRHALDVQSMTEDQIVATYGIARSTVFDLAHNRRWPKEQDPTPA